MTPYYIKDIIDEKNKAIEAILYVNKFTLNKEVDQLQREIEELQNMCEHNFENNVCKYCYKVKEEK